MGENPGPAEGGAPGGAGPIGRVPYEAPMAERSETPLSPLLRCLEEYATGAMLPPAVGPMGNPGACQVDDDRWRDPRSFPGVGGIPTEPVLVRLEGGQVMMMPDQVVRMLPRRAEVRYMEFPCGIEVRVPDGTLVEPGDALLAMRCPACGRCPHVVNVEGDVPSRVDV